MSILTDRQIRVRCQWQGKKLVQIRERGDVKVGETTILVDPREAARAYAMAVHTFGAGELLPFHVEDVSAEEAGFTPMITPFRPEQIRRIQREATPQEMAIFSVHNLLTQEEQLAALKAITPSAEGVGYVDEPDLSKPALRIQQKVISSGLSSMGYDVTLARDFKIFTNVNSEIIDPLNMNERIYHQNIDVDYCIIPPNSYILGHTEEWFDIPKDILALCLGKSTYARCGAIVNATPIEPGFKGRVVIEISNATNLPLKVYAGQGVAQFLFLQSTEDCEVGYGDRDNGKGGKYQNQTGLQTALV